MFACAQKTPKDQKNYCREVREAKFSYPFDFSGLYNEHDDYMIRHEQDKYLRIQLCGPLKNDCNRLPGYAICLYDKGMEFGIGEMMIILLDCDVRISQWGRWIVEW